MPAGRPRTPTAQKKAKGTFRPDRANPKEPQYALGAPPMPASLSREAALEWQSIVKELMRQRVLASIDGGVLAAYCEAVAELGRCTAAMGDEQFYTSPGGLIKEHPAAKARREAMLRIATLGSLLGLNPSARAKVSSIPDPEEDDPLAKLMAERGADPN